MENAVPPDQDEELQAQLTILTASHHDIESLRSLLRKTSASVRDPDTGTTPLHAAIAACEGTETESRTQPNGQSSDEHGPDDQSRPGELTLVLASKAVRLLLQNGAIWNDIDKNDETPGCIALRLGLKSLYEVMVDAGVRAEMLLNRLDEYHQLANDESDGDERQSNDVDPSEGGDDSGEENGEAPSMGDGRQDNQTDPHGSAYLQSRLRFQDDRILDEDRNGVMMEWESGIMKRTADLLVPSTGLRVLNIGHGMGIIDTFFQSKNPESHHIVEAHPDVVSRMKENGWQDKPNVSIHEGRWQDIVPKLISEGVMFDTIYFDSFGEDYKALRDFFSDSVVGLLDDGGRWGFFNGLGADRQICYDVYGKVVEMDLFEAGFDVEWETIQTPDMGDRDWEGVRRKYWALREYRLPVCTFSD